jgi:hypothetical protein
LTCLGLLFFHFLEELNLMQLFTFVANWDTAVSRNRTLRKEFMENINLKK